MPSTGKDKAQKHRAENAKKKASLVTLQSLQGKKPEDLNKAERIAYDRAVGQLLGILDGEGRVNVS